MKFWAGFLEESGLMWEDGVKKKLFFLVQSVRGKFLVQWSQVGCCLSFVEFYRNWLLTMFLRLGSMMADFEFGNLLSAYRSL